MGNRTFPRSRCGSPEWSRLAERRAYSGVGSTGDSSILQRIGELVDDEHRLHEHGEENHGLSEDGEARLRGLEVAPDATLSRTKNRGSPANYRESSQLLV